MGNKTQEINQEEIKNKTTMKTSGEDMTEEEIQKWFEKESSNLLRFFYVSIILSAIAMPMIAGIRFAYDFNLFPEFFNYKFSYSLAFLMFALNGCSLLLGLANLR